MSVIMLIKIITKIILFSHKGSSTIELKQNKLLRDKPPIIEGKIKNIIPTFIRLEASDSDLKISREEKKVNSSISIRIEYPAVNNVAARHNNTSHIRLLDIKNCSRIESLE